MSVRVLFVGCGLSAGLLFRGLTRLLRSSSAVTGVAPSSVSTLDKSCTSFTSVSNSSGSSSGSSSSGSGEDCSASAGSTDASRAPDVPSFSFHFWESSSSVGGRLYSHHNTRSNTASSSTTSCTSNDSGSFANTGAQYFTFGPSDLDLSNPNPNPNTERAFTSYLIQDLLANGVLAPMPAYQPEDIISRSRTPEGSVLSSESSGIPLIANVRSDHFTKRHFIAPRGTSSVVEHLLKSSSSSSSSNCSGNSNYGIDYESKDIECNKSLTSLTFNRDRNHWEASSTSNSAEYFDMVFLSIPFPNLIQIEGNWLDYVAKFGDFGRNISCSNSSSSSSGGSSEGDSVASDKNNNAESLLRAFKTVQYSSRFAVVYTFSIKNISSSSGDSVVDFFRRISYNAKYTPTGSILRYMSLFGVEGVRNSNNVPVHEDKDGDGGIDGHEPVVNNVTLNILLHSSPQYYFEKKLVDDDSISSEIFQSMLQLLSDDSSLSIPAVSSILGPPIETYFKRWDISQKIETSSTSTSSSNQHQPFNSADLCSRSILAAPLKTTQDGKPHFLSVGNPIIGIFGDSFTSSNFLGCVMTAESLLNKLTTSSSTTGK